VDKVTWLNAGVDELSFDGLRFLSSG
jgi:hypothetical protein